MAVDWQLVEMPLNGVDQFTDAPHVLASQLREAYNVRFREPPKAGKRYGLAQMPSVDLDGNVITRGTRLHAHRTNTILCSDSVGYVLAEKSNRWANRGRLSELHVERLPIHHDQAHDMKDADLAYNQGMLLVAWPAGQGQTTAVLIDTNSESVVAAIQNDSLSTTTWVRVVAIGNDIIIFSDWDGVNNSVKYRQVTVTGTSYTFTAAALVGLTGAPSVSASPLVDVCALDASNLAIIYRNNGTSHLLVERIDKATMTTAANKDLGPFTPVSVAVEGVTGENVYAAWDGGSSTVKGIVLDASTLVQVAAATSMDLSATAQRIGIARVNATLRCVVWEKEDVPTPSHIFPQTRYRNLQSTGSPQGTGPQALLDVVPTSKPFNRDGRVYCWVAFESTEQPTFYLAELTDNSGLVQTNARWCGTAARGIAKPASTLGYLHSVWQTTAIDKFETALTCNYRFRFQGGNDQTITVARAGVYRLKQDFAAGYRHEFAPWGDSMFFAGAKPSMYDGFGFHEHGFAWYPERWDESGSSSSGQISGNVTQDGKVLWCLVYEWEDERGQIHRSTPSKVQTTTIHNNLATNLITATLREQLWTTHGSFGAIWAASTNVRAVPYRTTLNGTRLYRDATVGYDAAYATVVKIGFEFNDTQLVLQDVLYTDGDILDNAGTPPSSLCAFHGGRMWMAGGEEPEWLWFSQPFVEGEAPRFNEGLRVLIGKPVRAIGSMDEKLICWTDTEIYAVVGDGPPATGGLDVGFAVALISSDTGCQEPRSLRITKDGIGFKGNKSYAMLDRGNQVQWIGLPAKNYFDSYPLIVGADLEADGTHLVVAARRADGTSVRHVYNLTTQQWTLDIITQGTIADSGLVWSGTAQKFLNAFVLTNGAAYQETPGAWLDQALSIPWLITTAWIKMNTIQGWQWIKSALLFGDFLGDAWGIQVRVGYNYDAAVWTSTYQFNNIPGMGLDRLQLEVDFEHMGCEAFRLEITELFPFGEGTNSSGPNLRSIVFNAGFEQGPFRIQDAARA